VLPAQSRPALPGARARRLCAIALVGAGVGLIAGSAALAADGGPDRIQSGRAARQGVSQPLTEIARRAAGASKEAPRAGTPATPISLRRAAATVGGGVPSPFVQFDGASFDDNLQFYEDVFPPPDASGAKGPLHYVQAINLVFRIFDESGNTVLGPLPTASLWTDLGGVCATQAAVTPLVRYDQLSDRWVLAQSAFDSSDASVHECVAASVSGDPTAAYYLYDFPLGASAQGRSARLGLWPDAYFVTVNQVEGFSPAGFGVYAFDRQAMLAGDAVSYVYANPGADLPNTIWGLPSDLDGLTPPAAGAPNVIAAIGHPLIDGSPAALLHVWKFHPNFSDPPSSTFEGPVDLAQDDFSPLDCGGPTQGCVPQLGSEQLLQATPNRLMSRMPYRKFGDHDALIATFTVDAGGGQAAPRWFELRDPILNPTVFQQGTYAPDSSHRFVPSIAFDDVGDVALAYNKSDATIHPSLALTARLPGDPPGTMPEENVFFEGPNSQPPVVGLWGSYSWLSVDPAHPCGFWFTAEYTGDPTPFFERTRIAEFLLPCADDFPGTLEGTVTDSASGSPIPGAQVHVSFGLSTVTDAAGHYKFLAISQGTWDVTVSKYGYVPATANGVVIVVDQTTTQDFALAPAPQALLDGTVKDGSGGGWALYARVTVSGPGFGSATLYTDPVTGYYGITLVAGVPYTLSTQAILPGYLPDQRSVLLQASGASLPQGVQNIALTMDATTCSAPGYSLVANGVSEHFDGGVLPPGWQVVNDGGGAGWTIQSAGDPCGLFTGNDTGGSGAYALINSHCEGEVLEDAQLITAPLDASALSSVQVRFAQELNGAFPPAGESAEVDVSTDGGGTWTNVLHESTSALGPNTQSLDVTALAAGQPDVRARFHYFNAFSAWWWQVDDVILGETSCDARPGGLVVGNVSDANTGAGLNGAVVAREGSGESTQTFATPDDPTQPDGLYVLFSPSAGQTLTASELRHNYASQSKPIVVVPGATQRLDFQLDAGRLSVAPASFSIRVNPGETVQENLDLTNIGHHFGVNVGIRELYVPSSASGAAPVGGSFADPALVGALRRAAASAGLSDGRTARGLAPLPRRPAARALEAGNVAASYPTGLSDGWGMAFDTEFGNFWVSNSRLFAGDGLEYQFLPDGTQTSNTIDDSSWIADWAGDGAYDPRTLNMWRVNVGGDDCVYEIDPTLKVATGKKICPAFGVSQRGLAYDVVSDTFYSGSWVDGVVEHFDGTGAILDSAYVGVAISGMAFNPANGRLYVLTSHDVLLGPDVYVFDTRNHYAVLGAFFVTSGGSPVMSAFGGAGLEMDCDGHLWLVDAEAQVIYEVESEETGACFFDDIPWLTENPPSPSVPPGATIHVVCTFGQNALPAGFRQGELVVYQDSPYPADRVPVDLTIRFLDVPDENTFNPYIYGAAGAGVMPGCGDPLAYLFCPDALVTRADMAAYILRAVHGPAFVPTPYQGAFADVRAGDHNADYIQSFYDEGYTVGCGGGNFCPTAVHTRAQTSVFILKGAHGPSYVPPPCQGVFGDVPCPSPFADWIEDLYAAGITAGCGAGNFCPDAGIPNQQMAVFLVRAFHIPHL